MWGKTSSGVSVVSEGTVAGEITSSEINESTVVHGASSFQDTPAQGERNPPSEIPKQRSSEPAHELNQEELSPPTQLAYPMAFWPSLSPPSEIPMGTDPSPDTEGLSLNPSHPSPSNDSEEKRIPRQVQVGVLIMKILR